MAQIKEEQKIEKVKIFQHTIEVVNFFHAQHLCFTFNALPFNSFKPS